MKLAVRAESKAVSERSGALLGILPFDDGQPHRAVIEALRSDWVRLPAVLPALTNWEEIVNRHAAPLTKAPEGAHINPALCVMRLDDARDVFSGQRRGMRAE